MKISSGISQNQFFNVQCVNHSIAAKKGSYVENQGTRDSNFDRATLTASGKRNSLLENLMKQKQRIMEQKDSLISSAFENGGTLDSVKSQLDAYEEQLKSIDEQIAEATAQEMDKKPDPVEPQESSEPRTEAEIQNERLARITSLAADLEQAEVVDAVKTKIDGEARVLKSEIENDKMWAGSSEGARELIAKKEEKLSGMEQRSLNITAEIAERIAETAEETDKNNDVHSKLDG